MSVRERFVRAAWAALGTTRLGRVARDTRYTNAPVRLRRYALQRLLESVGASERAYWPMHPTSVVQGATGVVLGVETAPGIMPGCYIQGVGGVFVGSYSRIGPHVGLHSVNHEAHDNSRDVEAPVRLGEYCWLGMGAQILPGVTLGDFTVVGAGAIVTRSFPEGYCVLVGAPATPIRRLDPAQCTRRTTTSRHHGFIPEKDFEEFRRCHLRF